MIGFQIVQHDRGVGVDNAHLQQSPHAGIHVPYAVHHHAEVLEHVLALLIQAPSGLGELHALVGAQKQAHLQLVLQHGDLPADGGLGHV